MRIPLPLRVGSGALLVLCGAAWSPIGVDWLIGSGAPEEPELRVVLWSVALALCALGLLHFRARASPWLARLSFSVLALFLALPLCGELCVRTAIARGKETLRDELLYADSEADDDYWKLRRTWRGDARVSRAATDPLLGWGMPPSPKNPLGIVAEGRYAIDASAPAVLFFGDSFVAGPGPPSGQIPQMLGRELPGLPVLNYGVGGYCLGQIALRLERALPRFPQAYVIVGIFTRDIDRAILSVRSGPKPYWTVEDGALAVHGQPVSTDPEEWQAQNPPQIRSFFVALLVQAGRKLRAGGDRVEWDYRREQKREVGALLFERIVELVRAKERPLLFVLFDPRDRLGAPGWRERFCRELFERSGARWVDAGAALLRAAEQRGVGVQSFFRADNHPTEEGNAIIAAAVAEKVRTLGWTGGR